MNATSEQAGNTNILNLLFLYKKLFATELSATPPARHMFFELFF